MENQKGLSKYFNMGLSIAQMVFSKNPIASLVIGTVKAVVDKQDDGISNESVIATVEEMAKSTWNDLSDEKVVHIAKVVGMTKDEFDSFSNPQPKQQPKPKAQPKAK